MPDCPANGKQHRKKQHPLKKMKGCCSFRKPERYQSLRLIELLLALLASGAFPVIGQVLKCCTVMLGRIVYISADRADVFTAIRRQRNVSSEQNLFFAEANQTVRGENTGRRTKIVCRLPAFAFIIAYCAVLFDEKAADVTQMSCDSFGTPVDTLSAAWYNIHNRILYKFVFGYQVPA